MSLTIYNSLTLFCKNRHLPLLWCWELSLIFTISWKSPHTEMAGFLLGGLKFGRYVNIKKINIPSQLFPYENFFWNSELSRGSIWPFGTCWVNCLLLSVGLRTESQILSYMLGRIVVNVDICERQPGSLPNWLNQELEHYHNWVFICSG